MSLDRATSRESLTAASTASKSSRPRDGVRYSEREEIRA